MAGNNYEDHRFDSAGLSLRAVIIGFLLVAVVTLSSSYSAFVLHSTHLTTNYFPLGVIFPFFFLVAVVAVGWKFLRPAKALRPAELGFIFIMGLAASAAPTYGLTGYLISILGAPYYFASPENRWAEYFHSYIPSWICPQDRQAMQWFFDGLPPGKSIPWDVWVKPLIWWLSLLAVVHFACLCMIAILRKQWVERERLTYPLAEVPLEMVEESDGPRLMPKFMRSRLFWYGFSASMFFLLWNMVSYFNPMFPAIPRRFGYIRFGRGFPPINTNIYPPMTGIAFLLHLDVSFSVWFFYLLGIIQVGIFNKFGFTIGRADVYCSHPPAMGWQGFGAFVVMVGIGLWMARAHLRDVVLKAFDARHSVDDSGEILSYRTAFFGLVFSLCFIALWMRISGMTWVAIALFLFAAAVAYIGLTRIVVEGGLVFLRPPLIPQSFATHVLGTGSISPQCMTALGFSYVWYCDPIAIFMPSGANCAKIAHVLNLRRRAMLFAIVGALVAGTLIAVPFTLYLGYKHGAYNFGEWVFRGGAVTPFNTVVRNLANPASTDWKRLGFFGVGAVAMATLSLLRYRFTWWPLHPFGFPLAAVGQVKWSCFSVFVGWAAKFVIMRLGGIALYRKTKPFFDGLIMGYFTGSGISWFVDWIWFYGEGHNLYL